MVIKFEEVGWTHIDISISAQQRIANALKSVDVRIESIDISDIVTAYHSFKCLREYESEYRTYAGSLEHCFLEKILEHYLSLLLIKPKTGMIGVDIGCCQSVLPHLGRRVYGVRYFEQDLEYPSGIHGDRIGSNADAIPLPDNSVDFMTLHCTFEHFENDADTTFLIECARLLKKGGRTIILPLYLSESYCNITGETAAEKLAVIGFDNKADHYCLIPEWKNRFGRYYSPKAFVERIWRPAIEIGLHPRLYKIDNWSVIYKDLWLRWALALER